jgi:nitrite reductase/ring-hydroxylating ferredoxin subunit
MSDWVRVASLEEIEEGSLLGVEAEGEHIVLARVDGKVYALEDQCSHQEYPLSDGELEGERLECIYHGAVFDVCTGDAKQLPAIKPVKTYEVDLRDDDVYVDVE